LSKVILGDFLAKVFRRRTARSGRAKMDIV